MLTYKNTLANACTQQGPQIWVQTTSILTDISVWKQSLESWSQMIVKLHFPSLCDVPQQVGYRFFFLPTSLLSAHSSGKWKKRGWREKELCGQKAWELLWLVPWLNREYLQPQPESKLEFILSLPASTCFCMFLHLCFFHPDNYAGACTCLYSCCSFSVAIYTLNVISTSVHLCFYFQGLYSPSIHQPCVCCLRKG